MTGDFRIGDFRIAGVRDGGGVCGGGGVCDGGGVCGDGGERVVFGVASGDVVGMLLCLSLGGEKLPGFCHVIVADSVLSATDMQV
jgi:hypothetical protein